MMDFFVKDENKLYVVYKVAVVFVITRYFKSSGHWFFVVVVSNIFNWSNNLDQYERIPYLVRA